jgi:hypothetical protein
LETFGGKLLLDSDLSTMAKQQNVIDATIDLIKGGKDASEVLKCCKSLVKDDLFLLIGLLSSLKTIEEDKNDNDTTQVKLDESIPSIGYYYCHYRCRRSKRG